MVCRRHENSWGLAWPTPIVLTKASAVKTTIAGTAVLMRSIAGDRGTTVAVPQDAAPLIDGACGRIGVRMTLAPAAWCRLLQ